MSDDTLELRNELCLFAAANGFKYKLLLSSSTHVGALFIGTTQVCRIERSDRFRGTRWFIAFGPHLPRRERLPSWREPSVRRMKLADLLVAIKPYLRVATPYERAEEEVKAAVAEAGFRKSDDINSVLTEYNNVVMSQPGVVKALATLLEEGRVDTSGLSEEDRAMLSAHHKIQQASLRYELTHWLLTTSLPHVAKQYAQGV